ncbi:MAG: hypothetical protein PHF34_02535 [Bacteroidales bacterium]|nr:hypothetical protein [Bacteroidales bacterium]
MKIKLFFSILIVFSFTTVFGNNNFVKGFIITNDHDTVVGLLDFKTDLLNSTICKFKVDENSPVKTYLPGEIYGFRFFDEGKFYVSKNVNLDDSLNVNVFVEFLVQGMLNLYYLDNDWREYYFYEKEPGKMISVTKQSDIIVNDKIKVDNRYKGVLTYVFKDYVPLAAKTKDAEFEKKSMIEYTKVYHDKMCKSGESCIIFENDYKKKFAKYTFSVYSGMEYNQLTISTSGFFDLHQMPSISPIIGAEISLYRPRFSKGLHLMLDVNLAKIIGYDEYINSRKESYFLYRISATKLTSNIGLKYIFTESKLKPNIELAYSRVNMLDKKYSIKEDYLNTVINSVQTNDSRKAEESFLFGNGYRIGCGLGYPILTNRYINLSLLYYCHKPRYYDDKLKTYQIKLGFQF